jgi:hypothetical protein
MWVDAHAERQEDSMGGIKFRSAVKAASVAAAMFAAPAALVAVSVSSASASAGQATLMPGEVLYGGQSLADGSYTMVMQTDGNFVLYANGNRALWQSHTYNNPGSDVVMQTDGNLVVYSPGGQALWQSGTYNQPGDHLVVQTDGNVVIYTPSGGAPWFTNTVQTPPSSSGQRAVAWEQAHASSQNWNNLCETAVEHAYGVYGVGHGGFYTAIDNYHTQRAAGRIHTDRNAPTGALVFFSGDSSAGHVGLAAGDGHNYYTTDGGTIHLAPLSEGGTYYGWSYAPTSWPGV